MSDGSMQADRGGLDFSPEALLVRSDFYDGHNEINLYVEDAGSQYLYEEVFKRLLGSDYNIKTIFPQGGKHNVIKAYREKGRSTDGIRNVYVVDGDFDRLICPEQMVNDSQFVYLHMYDIESCLIGEAGVCSIAKGKLKCIDEEVREKVRYSEWRARIVDEAKELFLCYCYIQKEALGIPNVNRNDYEFLDQKTGFQRTDGSFERFQSELFESYPDAMEGVEVLRREFLHLYGQCFERLICGKFLLTSLHDYLYTVVEYSIPKDDILFQLARSFDVRELAYIREACEAVTVSNLDTSGILHLP